jgi:hypothetical protein
MEDTQNRCEWNATGRSFDKSELVSVLYDWHRLVSLFAPLVVFEV